MSTTPHITSQEQRHWAAGTLGTLSTWLLCPWGVRKHLACLTPHCTMSWGSGGNSDVDDTGDREEGEKQHDAFLILWDAVSILTIRSAESHLLQKTLNIRLFYIPSSPILTPEAENPLSWQHMEKWLHCFAFHMVLLTPRGATGSAQQQRSAVIFSSGPQQQCWHCTPRAGREEGSQDLPWHRSSSVRQLHHFPEVHTSLLLLLGRIQSVTCDK